MEKCSRTEHREARIQLQVEKERALLTVVSGFVFYSVGTEEEDNENFDLRKKVKDQHIPNVSHSLGLRLLCPALLYEAQNTSPHQAQRLPRRVTWCR